MQNWFGVGGWAEPFSKHPDIIFCLSGDLILLTLVRKQTLLWAIFILKGLHLRGLFSPPMSCHSLISGDTCRRATLQATTAGKEGEAPFGETEAVPPCLWIYVNDVYPSLATKWTQSARWCKYAASCLRLFHRTTISLAGMETWMARLDKCQLFTARAEFESWTSLTTWIWLQAWLSCVWQFPGVRFFQSLLRCPGRHPGWAGSSPSDWQQQQIWWE